MYSCKSKLVHTCGSKDYFACQFSASLTIFIHQDSPFLYSPWLAVGENKY